MNDSTSSARGGASDPHPLGFMHPGSKTIDIGQGRALIIARGGVYWQQRADLRPKLKALAGKGTCGRCGVPECKSTALFVLAGSMPGQPMLVRCGPHLPADAHHRVLLGVGVPVMYAFASHARLRTLIAHERVQAQYGDGVWFKAHPERRFRARPPASWREAMGRSSEMPGSVLYALVDRDHPEAMPWVSRVVLNFRLDAPPPEIDDSAVDALIEKIIHDELEGVPGQVHELDDADLEREREIGRRAQYAAETALTAAARGKRGAT